MNISDTYFDSVGKGVVIGKVLSRYERIGEEPIVAEFVTGGAMLK